MLLSDSHDTVDENSIISELEWQKILEYLIEHAQDRPFHLEEIASKLNISLSQIVTIFSMLRKSFNLFHIIQQEKMINQEDLFSYSHPLGKEEIYSITKKEMGRYSTFVYLFIKLNRYPIQLSSDIKFRNLIEKYPNLFQLSQSAWEPSEMGKYFVNQYKKYVKLKTPCPVLEYKNFRLELIQDIPDFR